MHTPAELAEQAIQAYQKEEYLLAAETFKAAAQGYAAAGEWLLRAEMANNQSVALLQASEAKAALDAVMGTPDEFADAGEVRLQAMALGNQAAALDALGRTGDAERDYIQSADLLQSIGETDLRAHVLQSLSQIQLKTGRQLEALTSMQSGLDGLQRPSFKQRLVKRLFKKPFDLLKC